MKSIVAILLLFACNANAQEIPCGTNTIIVKGVTFNQACTALLDSGYIIERKDAELQSAGTQSRHYPKRFSATYIINCRVKDSAAYFTVTFTAPADGSIVRNEPSIYECKKSGKPIDNIFTYPFMLAHDFVKCFGKPINYTKQK